MSSNSQSESNLPKALAADLKKFDKAELQKTKTEEKILTPSLAAAGKPIKSETPTHCVGGDIDENPNIHGHGHKMSKMYFLMEFYLKLDHSWPMKFLEIAREKSLEALASFDQESKLKHIDVKEKNTLPTKEQILLEKQNK